MVYSHLRLFVHRRDFLLSTAAFGILACRPAGTDRPESPEDTEFTTLRDQYFLRHLELNPVTATYLGGDGYHANLASINGKLRDYRSKALEAEVAFYRDVDRQLAAMDPNTLPTRSRIDYRLIRAQIAFMLRQTVDRRYHQRAVDTYVAEPFRGVDWQIQQMTPGNGTDLGTEEEWSFVVTRMAAIPAYLMIARENLLAGAEADNRPDKRLVDRDGIKGATANAEYFRKTLVDTARGYLGTRGFGQQTLTQLTDAGTKAAQAWDEFAAFLGKTFDVNEEVDRFAIGEEEYAWRVKNILRDFRSPAELFEYGQQQVIIYTDQIVEIARKVASKAELDVSWSTPGERSASVRKVMEHLSSSDSPENDDELLRWYREAGARAVEYGRAQQLFDVPVDYRLDIVPTPPVLRSTIDAAYYPAPPFKKTGVGRFYLTPTGNEPAALEAQNRASVADTAVHEGFPGHDWHYKYMTKHADTISNVRWLTPGAVEDSSSMWSDSMAAEGWALYAEELMAQPAPEKPYGFYTAGEYLYELQGQLLRAVRIRVDVGIHTGRMSFDEAIDYFTEHVDFFPRARARAEEDPDAKAAADTALRAIYRYSKWPTQAITYNLGKNAIISLREAVRRREGSTFSARNFHERFMRMGTLPAGYFTTETLVR